MHGYAAPTVSTTQSRSLIPVEVAGVALVAVATTSVIAAPGGVPGWEQRMFSIFNDLPGWLFPILWTPMQLGSIVGAGVVVAAFLVVRRRLFAVTYAVATLAAWLVAVGVKQMVARERPLAAGLDAIVRGADASGFGFVSGHTTVAFAGATVIWVLYRRRWGTVAYSLAVIVGLTRMYVGAHLPLDVLGGAAAGTIVGGLITWLELRWSSRVRGPATFRSE